MSLSPSGTMSPVYLQPPYEGVGSCLKRVSVPDRALLRFRRSGRELASVPAPRVVHDPRMVALYNPVSTTCSYISPCGKRSCTGLYPHMAIPVQRKCKLTCFGTSLFKTCISVPLFLRISCRYSITTLTSYSTFTIGSNSKHYLAIVSPRIN